MKNFGELADVRVIVSKQVTCVTKSFLPLFPSFAHVERRGMRRRARLRNRLAFTTPVAPDSIDPLQMVTMWGHVRTQVAKRPIKLAKNFLFGIDSPSR